VNWVLGSGGRMKLAWPRKSRNISMVLPPKLLGRSSADTPPIRNSAILRGSRLRNQELTSSTRPRPKVLEVILRSRIQSRASGMATISVSRLCISSTSISRSRILVTKSKWSRLAWATHNTSSNSSSSQLFGVSRWWAKPGEHTMTLRSLPASECTPYFTFSVVITDPPRSNSYRVRKPS